MDEIEFVDVSIRDGHQSLWATRMSAASMLPIAPAIDRAGFKIVQVCAGNHFVVSARYLRENPWEKLRLLVKAMPRTPLDAAVRSRGVWGFDIQPDSVIALVIRRLAAYGIRRLSIFDPTHDFPNIRDSIRIARAQGLKVQLCLVYTISPVHTDDYYARKAAEIAGLDVDFVLLKDSIGLLTPERTRTLVPAILKNLDGLPLEIHSHCTTGLAPLCYLEAIKLGVRTVHTATTPLANGNSLPSVEMTLKNIRRLGYTARLDPEALETIAAHFTNVARREGKPMGVPVEYDLSQYDHQIPGGMRSNLESMLSMRGESHRLEEVLEETIAVHKELGYPVMITPLSQLVGTQAVLNVVLGERYKLVPDEVFKYALGLYGNPVAPVDPDVLDRIFGSPRGKQFLNWQPPQPSIEDLRHQYGERLSDDQLLTRLMLPEESVEGILALMASPLETEYPGPALEQKEVAAVRELARWANLAYAHVQKGNLSITIQRNQPLDVGNLKVTMSKGSAPPGMGAAAGLSLPAPQAPPAAAVAPVLSAPHSPARAEAGQAPVQDDTVAIAAPTIGRFYAQPEPGAAPYVSLGSEVKADTTVGLVEVMKVFTSVHSGVIGVITEICVQDADSVEYGQVLFRVRPVAKASKKR